MRFTLEEEWNVSRTVLLNKIIKLDGVGVLEDRSVR